MSVSAGGGDALGPAAVVSTRPTDAAGAAELPGAPPLPPWLALPSPAAISAPPPPAAGSVLLARSSSMAPLLCQHATTSQMHRSS